MGAQKAAELADLWEQAQLNLGSHNIQCLNGRDAFRHSFYIARDLVVRDYGVGELNSVFKTSPPREVEDVMKLKDEPILFVDGYLAPTLDAMDKIFNWATSIRPPDSNTDNELRYAIVGAVCNRHLFVSAMCTCPSLCYSNEGEQQATMHLYYPANLLGSVM